MTRHHGRWTLKNAFWEMTRWSPNLNWKQGMDLTIKGSLINLQSILFTSVHSYAQTCWTLFAETRRIKCIFSQRYPPSACLRDVLSSPRSSIQVQSMPPHTRCDYYTLFPSELLRRAIQIWRVVIIRAVLQIAELSSHSAQSVQN
jgi:hypothetical protein